MFLKQICLQKMPYLHVKVLVLPHYCCSRKYPTTSLNRSRCSRNLTKQENLSLSDSCATPRPLMPPVYCTSGCFINSASSTRGAKSPSSSSSSASRLCRSLSEITLPRSVSRSVRPGGDLALFSLLPKPLKLLPLKPLLEKLLRVDCASGSSLPMKFTGKRFIDPRCADLSFLLRTSSKTSAMERSNAASAGDLCLRNSSSSSLLRCIFFFFSSPFFSQLSFALRGLDSPLNRRDAWFESIGRTSVAPCSSRRTLSDCPPSPMSPRVELVWRAGWVGEPLRLRLPTLPSLLPLDRLPEGDGTNMVVERGDLADSRTKWF
mmetsp:Transcript_16530/g.36631  ORF Transcript_16530/g.36631 Transcript_16530/m.36631 type:complete len:319 (-) Transcript_16530:662-1618(-)